MTLFHYTPQAECRPLHVVHLTRRNPPCERCPRHGDLELVPATELAPTVEGIDHEVAAGFLVFGCRDCLYNEYAPVQKWTSGGPTLHDLVEEALADRADEFESILEPM